MIITIISTIFGLVKLLVTSGLSTLSTLLFQLKVRSEDALFVILAFILPYRPVGQVVPKGRPGHAGIWPQYLSPTPSDSRSPCPGLNALANHGILPRNGRHIEYNTFVEAITSSYNLAPSAVSILVKGAFNFFDNGRGYLDLEDVTSHNVIEHDASFTRADMAFAPDQRKPHAKTIDLFLARASDGKHVSVTDLTYQSSIRRHECRATNGQYSLNSFSEKFFGDMNSAFITGIFGGLVDDLKIWLKEERFPDGWEPKARYSHGYPMLFGDITSLVIELNTDENAPLRSGDAYMTDQLTGATGSSFVNGSKKSKSN